MLLPPGGEGGDSGEIIPGQSIVFAALEVCLGVLSRRVPALNPAAQSTGFHVPVRASQMTDDVAQLLSNVVKLLAELPNLCSLPGMNLSTMFSIHANYDNRYCTNFCQLRFEDY